MPAQTRRFDLASERSVAIGRQLGREIREARLDRNLALRDIGAAIGVSVAQLSRIERGLSPNVPLVQIGRIAAAVGLEPSVKLYPAGSPIRDAAHSSLLGRFRRALHPSLTLRTEVPLPIQGDRRAWDATVTGVDWWIAVEAETKPRDFQALDRRIALKQRDSQAEHLVLILLDSRHNRELLGVNAEPIATRYPLPGRRALELLGAGVNPGGSSVILL